MCSIERFTIGGRESHRVRGEARSHAEVPPPILPGGGPDAPRIERRDDRERFSG
jgi:hypothetical protein